MNLLLERLLRHDRRLVAISLILVSVLCWGWILNGAGMAMDGLELTRHTATGMDTMPAPAWNITHVALMFFMWWIMMIAMMLPSATPVILLATALNRRSESSIKPYGSAAAFTSAYLLTWAGFSVLAVAAQWALQITGLMSGMLRNTSPGLNAVLLIAAGAWQFTALKHACLRHCRGPIDFLTRHRRGGNAGAMLMGTRHGLYCLGCCWFLMALLFVGGVMNLFWIAGLAIYVWIEKVLPSGEAISRVMGGLLIAWGIGILVTSLTL